MGIFKEMNARRLADFFGDVCKKWDAMSEEERASGDFINPDEPVVLRVPNPAWVEGEDGPYATDDMGEDTHLSFHVQSVGGGGDVDEDGINCGHDGASLGALEINYDKYLSQGRRRKAKTD